MTCENLHKGDIVKHFGRKKRVAEIWRNCPDGHHEVVVYDLAEHGEIQFRSHFDDRPTSVFGDIDSLEVVTE